MLIKLTRADTKKTIRFNPYHIVIVDGEVSLADRTEGANSYVYFSDEEGYQPWKIVENPEQILRKMNIVNK